MNTPGISDFAPAQHVTTKGLMELWIHDVKVEVLVSAKELSLYDPVLGYRDLRAAFELGGASTRDNLWVITAWNPGAIEREARFNRLDQARMLLELARDGFRCFPSRGSAEGWEEPGTAFLSPSGERAAALAGRFGQLGYYRFSRTEGYCVDATGHFPETRLSPDKGDPAA